MFSSRVSGAHRRLVGVAAAIGMLALVLVTTSTVLTGATGIGATPASAATVSKVGQVSGGLDFTCAVTSTGAAVCWGANSSGQLGNGTTTASASPVQVSGLGSGVVAVSAGQQFACALRDTGGVVCWGANSTRQLGNGTTVGSTVPVPVSGLGSGVVKVSAGSSAACALLDSGRVMCWGNNFTGALGSGIGTTPTVPVYVDGIDGTTAVAVDVDQGTTFGCAVLSTGTATCWGTNNSGQLGRGTVSFSSSNAPAPVTGLAGASRIVTGNTHACALLDTGGIRCWGNNAFGSLGDGSTTRSLVPVAVSPLPSGAAAASIAAGAAATCAIDVDGDASCWGQNDGGQVGDGTTTIRTVPTAVVGLGQPALAIDANIHSAAGYGHVCSLVQDQRIRCWGRNQATQLGRTTGSLLAPGDVDGSLTFGVASTPTNRPPQYQTFEIPGVRGAEITFNLLAVDPDGDPLTFAADAEQPYLSPGTTWSCTTAGACTMSIPSDSQVGLRGFAWSVTDGTETVRISSQFYVTNSAPVASPSTVNDVQRGRPPSEAPFSLHAVDVNHDTIAYAVASTSGLPAGTDLSCSTAGECTVAVPADTPLGDYSFTFTADDGAATSAPATVTVGVGNTAPEAFPSGLFDVRLGESIPITLEGADFNGDTLAFEAPVQPAAKGDVTTLGNVATYRATSGKGLDQFTFRTSDSDASSAEATVSVFIANEAPTTQPVHVDAMAGDETLFDLVGADANGDELQFWMTNPPSDPDLHVDCDPSGHCRVFVFGGRSRQVTLEYVANDGEANSDPATVTIDVTRINHPPVAQDLFVQAPRGIGTHIVLQGDDPLDGDPVTFRVVPDQGPFSGSLDCNGAAGEDCIYTPFPGTSGNDSFRYVANDGEDDSGRRARVDIDITNQAPTADPAALSTPRGQELPLQLTGSDPNVDELTFAVVDQPAKGTVSCDDQGSCSYLPRPNTTGTDSFTFRTFDGDLESEPARVTFTLTNQAPVADARMLEVGARVPTPVALSASDPNGDDLTFAIATPPSKGTVACDPVDTSSCTYTSGAGTSGTDSFTFTASDGDRTSSAKTVSITITNAAPTANDQATNAPRGVATPVLLTAADPDADAMTFSLVAQPTKGLVTCDGADGSECSYTAGPGASGTDSFTFVASDGTFTSDPARVTITITNQAPVANAQTVSANAPLSGTPVALTAMDPNDDLLTYEVTTPPAKGTVSCTGVLCSYTAKAGVIGSDSFKFTVTDIGGLSSTATVKVLLDSTTPGVFIGTADKVESESGGGRAFIVPLTLSQPSPVPLTIWFSSSDGTATGNLDYTKWGTAASPRSITIAAGATWASINVPVKEDALVEGDETFRLNLLSVSGGAAYLAPGATEVVIRDAASVARSSTATPILSVTSVVQFEGNSASTSSRKAQVRVELSKAATSTVTVTYRTEDGSAVAGTDYTGKSGTLTFKPGDLEKVIDLSVLANAVAQPNRSFTITITSVTGATVATANASGTVTLLDEDAGVASSTPTG